MAEFEYENEENDHDFKVEEMKVPRVSSWINDANGKTLRGVVLGNNNDNIVCGDDHDGRENRCEFDVCPICYKAWTSDGMHLICCLPCGHIYGMSCINTWLKRSQSSGRCPQCNTLCTLKDVRLLYATRLCVAEHKAPAPRRFPFTKHGAREFNRYIKRLRFDTMELLTDTLERQSDVAVQLYDASKLQLQLQTDTLITSRAHGLKRKADALGPRVEAFKRQAYELGRRADALVRRVDACNTSMDFFNQSYKEHMRLQHNQH